MRLADSLRAKPVGPVHLVPFLPAGYGPAGTTADCVKAVAAAGATAVEVGIPYSDPIADGPKIQAAYHAALEAGTTPDDAIEQGAAGNLPRLAMVSYSLVRRRGEAAFCEKLAEHGYDGVLVPDLPQHEAVAFASVAKSHGVAPVLLVAPTTSPARRDAIGELADGFVYYLSVAGTTGERAGLPDELAAGVADMKQRTDLPVCVGFGISRPEHLQQLAGVADGAIVGSAFVAAVAAEDSAALAAAACGRLVRRLLGTA
jgi:tryptophan synthase alpha chain